MLYSFESKEQKKKKKKKKKKNTMYMMFICKYNVQRLRYQQQYSYEILQLSQVSDHKLTL